MVITIKNRNLLMMWKLLFVFLMMGTQVLKGSSESHVSVQIQEESNPTSSYKEAPIWSRAYGVVRSYAYLAASLTLIGGAAGLVAGHEYLTQTAQGTPDQWAVSGACTQAIKMVLIPSVCLSTARVCMSKIRSVFEKIMGHHRPIDTHKIAAGLMVGAAGIHSFCSLYWDPQSLTTHNGVTGMAMWGAIGLPLLGSYAIKDLPCLKPITYTTKFLRPHQFGFLLFSIAYGLHDPDLELLPWIAGPFGAVLLDRTVEFVACSYPTEFRELKKVGDQVRAIIERPAGFENQTGDYVYLTLPEGSNHPFTIAGYDEQSLEFIIGACGTKTRDLLEEVSNLELPMETELTGPFRSHIEKAPLGGLTFTISTGSGLSPYTSLLSDPEGLELILIHSERNLKSFETLIQSISQALGRGVHVKKVHLFLTSNTQDESEPLMNPKQRLQGMIRNLVGINQESLFVIHEGRFLPERLGETLKGEDPLRELQDEFLQNRGLSVVNFCGNKTLGIKIQDFCHRYGIPFYEDSFQF
jgi:hypothetical protein